MIELPLLEANRGCQLCSDLAGSRQQVVTGDGNPSGRLLILCDSPRPDDEVMGRPLADRSGEIFRGMLKEAGLLEEVWITYLVKCPSLKSGTRPTKTSFVACRDNWLKQEAQALRPKVVLALGAAAIELLAGPKKSTNKSDKYYGLPHHFQKRVAGLPGIFYPWYSHHWIAMRGKLVVQQTERFLLYLKEQL